MVVVVSGLVEVGGELVVFRSLCAPVTRSSNGLDLDLDLNLDFLIVILVSILIEILKLKLILL